MFFSFFPSLSVRVGLFRRSRVCVRNNGSERGKSVLGNARGKRRGATRDGAILGKPVSVLECEKYEDLDPDLCARRDCRDENREDDREKR